MIDPRNHRTISRRDFLRAYAAAVAFSIVPASVLGQNAPSKQINIAIIGAGGQGRTNAQGLLQHNDARIVALCDVNEIADYDKFYYRGVAGRRPVRELIEKHYAKQKAARAYNGCKEFIDFRDLLAKDPGLDAVLIATPDHVHAFATLAALKKHKHVYCEKPLTHSVAEARKIAAAARAAGVVTQMGNQGHSGEGIRLTCEWIWDGAIGDVHTVHAWSDTGYWAGKLTGRPTDTPPLPKGLHWDLWLCAAQKRPYHPAYHPFNWRGWWDFGTGTIGDMACHNMDPAFWALKLGHPATVEGNPTELVSAETTPNKNIIRYEYPARDGMPPVQIIWHDGGLRPNRPAELEEGRRMDTNGIIFHGAKGVIMCPGWAGTPRIIPETKMKAYKRPPKSLPRTRGHHRDWLDAIHQGGAARSSADFAYSAHLTEVILLGNVALRTGKKLQWDGKNMKATNAPEADKFINPPRYNNWSLDA